MRVLGSVMAACVLAVATTTPAVAGVAHIRLRIVTTGADGIQHSWVLNCNPSTGSTHPRTKAACAKLNRSGPSLLAPVPRGTACSMIYGGAERATVTGTWGTRRIKAAFNRSNGCEVVRWQRAVTLLGSPRPGPAPTQRPASSLVTGRVSLGPTCPVQQAGQLCEKPSVDAVVTFTGGTAKFVARATVASGFRISLPAGQWSATADVGMRCPVVRFTAPTNAELVIACDTGIR